jgi:type IV pilus assembly protein PilA
MSPLPAARDERGFTMVELLIVILIVGILAAVAIPMFLNQKAKGEDANAKSAARQTQTALETFYNDQGDYNATVADLQRIETSVPDAGTTPGTQTLTNGTDTYTIRIHAPAGRWYEIQKTTSQVFRNCGPANDGGCKNDSTW